MLLGGEEIKCTIGKAHFDHHQVDNEEYFTYMAVPDDVPFDLLNCTCDESNETLNIILEDASPALIDAIRLSCGPINAQQS